MLLVLVPRGVVGAEGIAAEAMAILDAANFLLASESDVRSLGFVGVFSAIVETLVNSLDVLAGGGVALFFIVDVAVVVTAAAAATDLAPPLLLLLLLYLPSIICRGGVPAATVVTTLKVFLFSAFATTSSPS